MNGFANAILSLLLGWLRSLFNAVWALLGSDHSGSLVTLLRSQWKLIFLVMCVGGFVVDRVIYFIRWRPDYVWRSRHRRRAQDEDSEYSPQPSPSYPAKYQTPAYLPPYAGNNRTMPQPYEAESYPDEPEPSNFYAPENLYQTPSQQAFFAPLAATPRTADMPDPSAYARVQPQRSSYAPVASQGFTPGTALGADASFQNGDTRSFSPNASFAPTISYQAIPNRAPIEPEPITDDPRFDDDPAYWNAPQSAFDDFRTDATPERNVAAGMVPVFGTPQAEPAHYLQDVQSGFAPQPTPEQLYTPHPESLEPIHPGLDIETFQQNIGLTNANALNNDSHRDEAESYPGFSPFSVTAQPETPDAKPRGLGALAKKARSFVSGDDERNPRSIRDLQPTVDMKNAFHAPVYPKKKSESEEE